MNRFFTKSFVLVALVGALTVFSTAKSEAAFFTGNVDYVGTSTADNANLTLATTTTLSDVEVQVVTGTFVIEGMAQDDPLVHANPIDFDGSGTPYTPLWTHVASGITFTLESLSLVSSGTTVGSNTFAVLAGSGYFSGAGYDDTPGTWVLTLNSSGNVVGSFSSSASVPEPLSLSLLGLGLAGVAARRRRVNQ